MRSGALSREKVKVVNSEGARRNRAQMHLVFFSLNSAASMLSTEA
jgi:hypothetical protein